MRSIYIVLLIFFKICLVRTEVLFAGHGVGAGDGFPLINFPQTVLPLMPQSAEINNFVYKIARTHPSIALRFLRLKNQFNSLNSQFQFIHMNGEYPYQLANSRHGDVVDNYRIPTSASITVWNNFFNRSAQEQLQTLIHEFVHILFTHDDEPSTVRLTALLLQETRSAEEVSELNTLLGQFVRVDSNASQNINNSIYSEIETLYVTSKQLSSACGEFDQNSDRDVVLIGTRHLRFPSVPEQWQQLLLNDVFFKEYRNRCFRSTSRRSIEDVFAARSLIDGFTQHPYLHRLFLQVLLPTTEIYFVLSAQNHAVRSNMPVTEGATELFNVLSRLSANHTVSPEQLREQIPGYARYEERRRALLLPDELEAPEHYSASDALRYFPSWVALMGSSTAWSNDAFRIIRVPAQQTVDCRFGSENTTNAGTSSRYQAQCQFTVPRILGLGRSVSQHAWVLGVEWAVQLMIDSQAGVRFYQWPGVRVVERQ